MNKQREILERILQGDSMPVAEPEHPDTSDFADFTRYLDGGYPYERRFDKFLPKERPVNGIQPAERVVYVERGGQKSRPLSSIVLIFAILYWLSPLDVIPMLPIDDIPVMLLALWYSGMFSGGGGGS